jgi:GxxExxY protein
MSNADSVASQIIGAAIKVHRTFGPGLLESVYTLCLGQELVEQGLAVDTEKPLSLKHKELTVNRAYVLDLLVDDCVIVEVKCVEKIKDVHVAQLLTYLRLTGITLGLIINFNVPLLKNGVRRVANKHVDENGKML